MLSKTKKSGVRLDALGLFLAGLINTFLALFIAGVLLAPGTAARQPDVLLRAEWIGQNSLLWQAGWFFWFAVTLSFAWSYFALGRHLQSAPPWSQLTIGLALIAAAVDIVGVLINLVILPDLALQLNGASSAQVSLLQIVYQSAESLAYVLVNVTAFGLYSLAGLLLLPAVFAETNYPRWLAWLGAVEWSIAFLATGLLVFAPGIATAPLLISFLLYAPWVWSSAIWLLRSR